ncbi:MAG: sigma-70 family RNA polymerase sigma factor [bacterium]|nr:sigma-70 family RNA polymerase sigma factor [bacterium]
MDETVVAAFQSGDEGVFQTILDRYESPIYRLILAMVCHVQDAQDLTQEVFVRVFEKRQQFKGESQLNTWITSIARFHTINFLRRSRAKQWLSLEHWMQRFGGDVQDDRNESNLDGIVAQSELQSVLTNAMSQLRFAERELIGLVDIHGLDYQAVARLQHCPVGNS